MTTDDAPLLARRQVPLAARSGRVCAMISKSLRAREPLLRRIAVAIATVVILGCVIRAMAKPWDGDFKVHWEFGRRLLAGELVASGPYPPFWALAHAPFALISVPIAKALFLPIGLTALVLLNRTLRQLTLELGGLGETRLFWVSALALFFSARYVMRDLAEVGVNTLLVALSWLAISLWREGKEARAAVCLGLAVALKCTPVIFIGLFAWKRQWRMVALTGASSLLFTICPIIWQGPTAYRQHMQTWAANAWIGFAQANPSFGTLGPEPLQNMALRPALARYLVHLPEGHHGRAEHAFYFHAFQLTPFAAAWVVRFTLASLIFGFLWWSRSPILSRRDPQLIWHFAGGSLLMLLLSPITWGQHCVALLPAWYLVSATWLTLGRLPRWMLAAIGGYAVMVLLLARDLVGRKWALLLGSYHLETVSMLALLAVLIGCSALKPFQTRVDPD